MNCQILFSGKNKKNISNLSSAELAQSLVRFKYMQFVPKPSAADSMRHEIVFGS